MSKPKFPWTQTSMQSAADASLTFSSLAIKLIPAHAEVGSLLSQPGRQMQQIEVSPGRTHVWKTGTGGGELKPFAEKGSLGNGRNGVIMANRAKTIWIQEGKVADTAESLL